MVSKRHKHITIIFIVFFVLSVFSIMSISKAHAYDCSNTNINNLVYTYANEDKTKITTQINLKNGSTADTNWAYSQNMQDVTYFSGGNPQKGSSNMKLYKNSGGSYSGLEDTYIIVENDTVTGYYHFYSFEPDYSILYTYIANLNSKPAYLVKLNWDTYYIKTSDGDLKQKQLIYEIFGHGYFDYAVKQQCAGNTKITSYTAYRSFTLTGVAGINKDNKPTTKLTWTYGANVSNLTYQIMRKEGSGAYTKISTLKDSNKSIFEYSDDTVVKGKTYTYQITLASTAAYKSNEVTVDIPLDTQTIKKCQDLMTNYENKIKEIEKKYNDYMSASNTTTQESLRTELDALVKEKDEIFNNITSNCDKNYIAKLNQINKNNEAMLNALNTAIVANVPTNISKKTPCAKKCENISGANTNFVYKMICEGFCLAGQSMMSLTQWSFCILKGAISTESKTYQQPACSDIFKSSSSNSGSSTTNTTNPSTTSSINTSGPLSNI